jgi:uncharacterized Ntn-hydrolase superfamily protein
MTFSIVGQCSRTGMVGVAITTSSICVGSRCPWVRAGVGAVATQNVTLPSLGPLVLDRLQAGDSPRDAVESVMAGRAHTAYRQLAVVDRQGRTAQFSGAKILGTNAVAQDDGCVAAGNLLQNDGVPQAMAEAFRQGAERHLADRLLTALESGLAAGGEMGPVRSAALLVADEQPWPLVDLRVDWDDDPVPRLRMLWTAYEPQMQDYVTRALAPDQAPSYGVPGDE